MSDDFQAWLEEGLDFSEEPAAPAPPAPAKAPSLSNQGIGRGGIIRNPTTKRKTLTTGNPVTTPQKPNPQKGVADSTPEEELKAQHPALAIPSIMTGMDHNTKNGAPETEERQPVDVSYTTTVLELLKMAQQHGGRFTFGFEGFAVISIQVAGGKASG